MLYQNVFIIFGLIAITASIKIKSDYNQLPLRDIQNLLKSIQDGNLDGNSQHHISHHGKPRYEDDHNLMNVQTLNLVFKHNNLRRDKLDKNNHIDTDNDKVNRIICAITGSYGCDNDDAKNKLQTDEGNKDRRDDTKLDDGKDLEYQDNQGLEEESKNDIESLLNDLEQKLLLDEEEKRDLRCRGNRCGRGRDDNVGRDDKNDDNDDVERKDDLRCRGYRCGRGRADDDRKDDLRCRGYRCGRGRADDDRKDDLRCRGYRCGRGRADDERKDDLRCRGYRCGRGRADDENDDRRDETRIDDLRCRGDQCERSRTHKNDAEIDSDFKSVLEKHGKRYKINNELDAIVLDVDDINDVLQSLEDTIAKDKISVDDELRIENNRGHHDWQQSKLGKHRPRERLQIIGNRKPTTLLQTLGDVNPFTVKKPLRSLLPLTLKQRMKIRQQAEKEKAQVPFVLEVQGLGQVNA